MVIAEKTSGEQVVGREFDRFVASASPGLLRAAYLLTGDRADAEDLLQSALLRVFRQWRTITGPPKAYAVAVLVNLSTITSVRSGAGPKPLPKTDGMLRLRRILSASCSTARRSFRRPGVYRARSRR